MNKDFAFVQANGIELLVYAPWWQQGIVHGMTTTSLECKRSNLVESAASLCAALGASELALAQQCHGAAVLDLRDSGVVASIKHEHGDLLCRREADVILAPLTTPPHQAPVAYGVMTADCVPIIVRGREGYALIHAGWRGLACGTVAAGIGALGTPSEALIFAAAGPELYEVGIEVIEAIGETAVYKSSSNSGGKYLLDTAQTAARQVANLAPGLVCHSASLCTIEDQRFHSFRREGALAGRCVTFIVPGSAAGVLGGIGRD